MTDIRIRRYKKDSELANDLFVDVLPAGAVTAVSEAKPGEVVDVSVDYDVVNAVDDVNDVMTSAGWTFVAENPGQSLDDAAKDITPQYVVSVHGRTGAVVSALGDYDATEVTYTPATPGDWPEAPDPTNEQEAIDYLAARTDLLGGGAQVITDTQAASAINLVAETSLVAVDVPDMVLTTANGGGTNVYVIWFNCEFELNTPNKSVFFQIEIDGVADADSMREIQISSANSPNNGGTMAWQADIGDGIDIKVLWWVDSGTASMRGRHLIIQGSE